MRRVTRIHLTSAALGMLLGTVLPVGLAAQPAAILGGLASNATDLNFFYQRVGSANAPWRPLPHSTAQGFGLELSWGLSAGTRRQRQSNTSCAARNQQQRLSQPCSDTAVTTFERDVTVGNVTYKDSLKITKFEPVDTLWYYELAIGFSQKGGFAGRIPNNDIFVSVRELPSVSFYASYQPSLLGLSPYLGVRTGLVSLVSGRAYTDTVVYTFGGDAFQLGPVLGLVRDLGPLTFFTEGAYLWRSLNSVEWAVPSKGGIPSSFPRTIDLSGWTFAAGLQFELQPHKGK